MPTRAGEARESRCPATPAAATIASRKAFLLLTREIFPRDPATVNPGRLCHRLVSRDNRPVTELLHDRHAPVHGRRGFDAAPASPGRRLPGGGRGAPAAAGAGVCRARRSGRRLADRVVRRLRTGASGRRGRGRRPAGAGGPRLAGRRAGEGTHGDPLRRPGGGGRPLRRSRRLSRRAHLCLRPPRTVCGRLRPGARWITRAARSLGPPSKDFTEPESSRSSCRRAPVQFPSSEPSGASAGGAGSHVVASSPRSWRLSSGRVLLTGGSSGSLADVPVPADRPGCAGDPGRRDTERRRTVGAALTTRAAAPSRASIPAAATPSPSPGSSGLDRSRGERCVDREPDRGSRLLHDVTGQPASRDAVNTERASRSEPVVWAAANGSTVSRISSATGRIAAAPARTSAPTVSPTEAGRSGGGQGAAMEIDPVPASWPAVQIAESRHRRGQRLGLGGHERSRPASSRSTSPRRP